MYSRQWGLSIGISMMLANAWAAPAVVDIGAQLEQAAMACEQKDTQRLSALSAEIRALVAQQASLKNQQNYIEKLLTLFANNICRPEDPALTARLNATTPVSTKATQFQFSTGYLDNVNQGSRHEFISVPDPLTGLPAQGRVDPNYLPLSSAFIGIQGVHRQVKNQGKTIDSATFMHQSYTDEPNFSMTGLGLSRLTKLKSNKIASTALEYIGDAKGNSRVTLSGNIYQPWVNTLTQKTGLNTGIEYARYPQQAAYDAITVNTSLEQRKLLNDKGVEWAARARLEYDHALQQRPGGDRTELELIGQWKGALSTHGWQPAVSVKAAYKVDTKAFDTRLFGESKRQQLSTALNIGTTKVLTKDKKLYLNYQRSRTQDKGVALFDQPTGNAVSVSLETNF